MSNYVEADAVFPDTDLPVPCPDRMTKLEAARWLRLHEPVSGAVTHELAGGDLVFEGPDRNWVNVGEIWERGCLCDPGDPLTDAERGVWRMVADRMVYKVEYLIRRGRLRAVKVGREHRLHIDELMRFVRGG